MAIMAWTEARVRHFLDTVMLGEVQITAGVIGPAKTLKNGMVRRPWGYIVTDKSRPGMEFKGRTPKQACESAGVSLTIISGYKGDK